MVQSAGLGRSISPELQSWIKDCLVPIMVTRYLGLTDKPLASNAETVRQSADKIVPPKLRPR